MNKNLPKILIALCLGLCLLAAVQWVREAGLREQVGKLTADVHERDRKILDMESRLKQWDSEITRLDLRVKELKSAEATNYAAVATANSAKRKTELELDQARRQINAFKEAVDVQNGNIRSQNEAIAKLNDAVKQQNELVKKLGDDRVQLAEQLNARTTEYNAVVEKFNALAKQIEQAAAKKE